MVKIKNMEKPEKCRDCQFYKTNYCFLVDKVISYEQAKELQPDCPIEKAE